MSNPRRTLIWDTELTISNSSNDTTDDSQQATQTIETPSPYHLLDHEYGVTPKNQIITRPLLSPVKTELCTVKRRLNLDDGNSKADRPKPTTIKKRQNANYFILKNKKHERSTRYDTSLGLLTKKFVGLLQNSTDGVIDLNIASAKLDVQKRRIYDITNVLEGIGILEKKSKNNIRWKGGRVSSQEYEGLQREIELLDRKEKQLDRLIRNADCNYRQMSQNKRYAYVTIDDLYSMGEDSKDQTLLAIKAPADTLLEVPRREDRKTDNIQMRMKSTRGPIDVRVLQDRCTGISDLDFARDKLNSPFKRARENNSTLYYPHQQQQTTPVKMNTIKNEPRSSPLCGSTEASSSSSSIAGVRADDLWGDDFTAYLMNDVGHSSADLNQIMVEPLLSLEAPSDDYRYSLCHDEGLRDQFLTPF